MSDAEDIIPNNNQVLSELIEQRFRANLDLLNEQILIITQLLIQLIQNNLVKLPQRWALELINPGQDVL